MRKISQNLRKKINNYSEYIERLEFKPLKIKFDFKIGRNGNDFIMLDSIVSYFCLLYVLGDDFFNLSIDFDDIIEVPIPIKKMKNNNGDFYYLCGGIKEIPNKVTWFVKRTLEPKTNIIKEAKVITNSGHFKNYKSPMLYSLSKSLTIPFIGNREELEKILPPIINIGKKSSIGFGQATWEIEEAEEFKILEGDGFIRPIPIWDDETISKASHLKKNSKLIGYKSPYFIYKCECVI